MDKVKLEIAFQKPLMEITKEYKAGDKEPLDGDEVDRLVEHLRNRLNYFEGNITADEYTELEEAI